MRCCVLALVLLAACGPPPWAVVAEDLDEGLLSVTGLATDDVWAVGGDAGDGPAVLHWDGASWDRVDVGSPGDLWWAWQAGADDVWMAGAEGRLLRLTPSSGEVVQEVLDPEVTLFGVWGASTDEVWAVGGDTSVAEDGAALFRYDGTAWAEVSLPADAAAEPALYKVWGASADDVWVVGTGGTSLHWDGADWSEEPTGTDRALFTAHGTGGDVWAVGGYGSGTIVRWDGSSWHDESPPGSPDFTGVYAEGEQVWAVGGQGGVWTRTDGAWTVDPRDPPTVEDLHATWVDPDGGVWVVGGAIRSLPLERGVLAYAGEAPPEPL